MSWKSLLKAAAWFLVARIIQSKLPEDTETVAEPQMVNKHEPLSSFQVYGFDIWYSYSCYLSTSISSLEEVARKALKSGLAELACISDGRCAWRRKGKIWIEPIRESDSVSYRSTETTIPETLDPSLEAPFFAVVRQRSAERRLFGTNDFPLASVTLMLPEFAVRIDASDTVKLRPQARIYSNGLVLFSLLLSENRTMGLDKFIERRVNLTLSPIDSVRIPGHLSDLLVRTVFWTEQSGSFPKRLKAIALRRLAADHFSKKIDKNGLPYVELNQDGSGTLSGLMNELVEAIAYCSGRPRTGLAYILLGEPRMLYPTGFWQATPHIHLRHFSGQQVSAQLNKKLHRDAFLRILVRSSTELGDAPGLNLPEDLRVFDDSIFYVGEASTLWVYGLLAEEPYMDGSPEHPFWSPTIEQEAKAEIIEFGIMLQRSFIHELEDRSLSWGRILAVWEETVQFDLALDEAGRFGEVRQSILAGLEIRGASRLRQTSSRLLKLRERSADLSESRRWRAFGYILTVAIGFLGLPSFANRVARDLLPQAWPDISHTTLILLTYGSSLIVLLSAILLTRLLFRRYIFVRWKARPMRR